MIEVPPARLPKGPVAVNPHGGICKGGRWATGVLTLTGRNNMTNPQEAFSHLLGLKAFDAKRGHGSFVTLSLSHSDGPREESGFVWICMCDWRILDCGEEIAHSESPEGDIDAATTRIEGRQLTAVVLNQYVTPDGLRHGATLVFSDRLSVRLYQYEHLNEVEPIFSTRSRSGTWASYQSDGTIETNEEKAKQVSGGNGGQRP